MHLVYPPASPTQYLYNRYFQFLRGITVVPREIPRQWLCNFFFAEGGLNKVRYGLCENGEWGRYLKAST